MPLDLRTWLNLKAELLAHAETEGRLTMPWERFEALLAAGRARLMDPCEPRAETMVTLPDGSRYQIYLGSDTPPVVQGAD
jgi:hypothetical protein